MIQLFDPARLRQRHDRTALLATGVLVLAACAVGGHTLWLHQRITAVTVERQVLQQALQKALSVRMPAVQAAPPPALLADLERQAERLEAEAGDMAGAQGLQLAPSQWLERLDALASPQVALLQVEIDRAGSARVEGQARSPQALAAYVQAWERLQAQAPMQAPMRARTVEVRQEMSPVATSTAAASPAAAAASAADPAPLLRFTLRAQAGGSDAPVRPSAAQPATQSATTPGVQPAAAP